MAFNTYMIIPGVPGEAKSKNLKDIHGAPVTTAPFEVFSFSWGASNPVTIGAGAGAGKPSVSSFNIMKKNELSSIPLFRSSLTGGALKSAQVLLVMAAGPATTFEQYDFSTVYVESIQWSGSSGGDDTPAESVSFAFTAGRISYLAPNKTIQTVQFNLATNQVGP